MAGEVKRCSKCGEVKAVGCFALRHNGADGRCGACKECKAAYVRNLKARNQAFAERERQNAKRWQQANPGAVEAHRRRDVERRRPALKERRDRLHPSYVAGLVSRGTFPRAAVPAELIEQKRKALYLHRLLREMEQALNEGAET